MREVILGHDGDSMIYSVPDEVANNLRKYCMNFCNKWIWNDPHAEKYRIVDEDGEICVAYCAEDFIEYLNDWILPNQPSVFVKNLGWTECGRKLPLEYKNYPCFHF